MRFLNDGSKVVYIKKTQQSFNYTNEGLYTWQIFFFFFLKTSNGREKWRVTALCVTLGVTAFFSGEECVLEYRREIAFHFTW